ncbi:MAG: AEC family transporter [Paracoccaceae bacterium]
MWDIFLKTLPFFALIGLGYSAARLRFFSQEAVASLTRFVFYFALSALIFRFTAKLPLGQLLDWDFILAYLSASTVVYLLATFVALRRNVGIAEAAIEAQCAVIGNVGFLGLPLLLLLLGESSVGPNLIVLIIDLVVFSNILVILITIGQQGQINLGTFKLIGNGLVRNPMILAIGAGMFWAGFMLSIPGPVDEFLSILGAAATPGALFVIGASLAAKSTERISVAMWLSFCKLVLHPAAVAVSALWIFSVEPYAAAVMIAVASLPVAGNIYILAQNYDVAPQRVSAAILVSTVASVVTVSLVVAWVSTNIIL